MPVIELDKLVAGDIKCIARTNIRKLIDRGLDKDKDKRVNLKCQVLIE